MCGARYKTRPGLSYHYNHSHKEKAGGGTTGSSETGNAPPTSVPPITSVSGGMEEIVHEEGVSAPSSVGGSSITPPSTPGLQESSLTSMDQMGAPVGVSTAAAGAKIRKNTEKRGCRNKRPHEKKAANAHL